MRDDHVGDALRRQLSIVYPEVVRPTVKEPLRVELVFGIILQKSLARRGNVSF
jgi:hypothetical protein